MHERRGLEQARSDPEHHGIGAGAVGRIRYLAARGEAMRGPRFKDLRGPDHGQVCGLAEREPRVRDGGAVFEADTCADGAAGGPERRTRTPHGGLGVTAALCVVFCLKHNP